MKDGKHQNIVSNENENTVRKKNVSQNRIQYYYRSRITKEGIRKINLIKWKYKIIILLILVLFVCGIKGTISYFTDTDSSVNEFAMINNYTVTFDSNTGSGTMEPQQIYYMVLHLDSV